MTATMIGKRIARVDGRAKVTGEAVYTSDVKLTGMLFGKIKRSPHAFARIKSIDTTRALALPGVKAVVTSRNVVQYPFGPYVQDELPLASEYVRYAGDEVAAVAAADENTAEAALDLIEVEYEVLTPVLTTDEALMPEAPAVHPEAKTVSQNTAHLVEYERGEGAAAFKKADLIVEDSFDTQAASHAYLEPQACVTMWDSTGHLTIWGGLQSPFRSRIQIARSLGIPEHKIRMILPYLGGGFGGKGGNAQRLYPICALLSKAAGKPVKIVLSRKEEFQAGRPRLSQKIHLRLGLKKDGTIIAKELTITGDGGAYVGMGINVLNLSASRTDSLYRIPNIKVTARLIYTNKIPRGAMRAIGNPQVHFGLESLIDEAAEKLGMDPVQIRIKNSVRQGDVTAAGWLLKGCALSECIERAAANSDWKNKRELAGKSRGVGIATQVHVSGQRGMHPLYDGSAAYIYLDQFGKARIVSGEMEIGQGSDTTLAQIAAEELGLPLEDIQIMGVDSDFSPFSLGTWGSRVTALGGNAVLLAARDARKQLVGFAAEKLEAREADIQLQNSQLSVRGSPEKTATIAEVANFAFFKQGGCPITGKGMFVTPEDVTVPNKKNRYGNASLAYPFSAQVAEVAVDRETGVVDVLGIWAVHDSGKIINPMLAEGQVEGGVVQGLGYTLTEGLAFKDGAILNDNLHDYKIPTAADIPPIYNEFIETENPGTPYGAKGLGEPPVTPVPAAIANAIQCAIGVRIRDLPITPEKILRALADKAGKK